MPEELLDTGAGVPAYQHPVAQTLGQLRQRGVEHRDLISGVTGVGPPGAQHRRQRFPGTTGAVIDERHHRVKPVSTLEVRGRAFFVRMGPDQGGIQIHHHLPNLSDRAALLPHPLPGDSPCLPDRGDRRARVAAQHLDESADRGIRGHCAEQFRLGPHQRSIGQAVTAEGDRDRQIQHRLARVVDRPRRPPWPQLPRQTRHQTADLRRLHQQRRARRRNQRLATRFDPNPTTTATLHLRSAFPLAEHGP